MQSVSKVIVKEIAKQTIENGGSTYDVCKKSFVESDDYWYFPKHPSKTSIVDSDILEEEIELYIKSNEGLWKEDAALLGTWINPDSKKCYLDITTRESDKNVAIKKARHVSEIEGRKIVTIYNPRLNQVEYIWEDVRT